MLPEDEQAEIARRRAICAVCEHNSSNAVSTGYKTERLDEHCVMCGCTISRKTMSLISNCGISCCNAKPDLECDCKRKTLKRFNQTHGIDLTPKWLAYKKEENEQ